MKYYTTPDWYEFLRETEEKYTPKDDHLKASERANEPVDKNPNDPVKPSAGFSTTPREGEVRSVETGLTLPAGKGKKKGKKKGKEEEGKVDEVRSAQQVRKDTEEQEFDKGVYGFHSDLTGTVKGYDAGKLRARRLKKTRLRRLVKVLKKVTSLGEAKKRRADPDDHDGGNAGEEDEAMEGRITQERLKFLERQRRSGK